MNDLEPQYEDTLRDIIESEGKKLEDMGFLQPEDYQPSEISPYVDPNA